MYEQKGKEMERQACDSVSIIAYETHVSMLPLYRNLKGSFNDWMIALGAIKINDHGILIDQRHCII